MNKGHYCRSGYRAKQAGSGSEAKRREVVLDRQQDKERHGERNDEYANRGENPGHHKQHSNNEAAFHGSYMTDNLSLLEPGRARVRLINASPDVLDLDLYIAGTETIVQRGVDASTVTTFTDLDPGTLEIRPVNRPAPPQFSNLEVEADRLYTFVVVGTSSALDLVQIEDRIEQVSELVLDR